MIKRLTKTLEIALKSGGFWRSDHLRICFWSISRYDLFSRHAERGTHRSD